jgi:hypothetical protein
LYLPPHSADNMVEVDMSKSFATLIVVRIKDNFACEARMIQRSALPAKKSGLHRLRWQSLPFQL